MLKVGYYIFFILHLLNSVSVNATPNAGILPYAYKNGTAYILFGLENRFQDVGHQWTQKAPNTWVWADFGGTCDLPDTTDAAKYGTDQATLCAAREGTEETRYVFGNTLPLKRGLDNKSPEYDTSVRYLIPRVKGRFTIKNSSGATLYEQFFAEVDYVDDAKINNSSSVPHDEKHEWKWISIHDLLDALKTKDANGFYTFNFQHASTNRLFPYLAKTLIRQDVQDFIKDTIIAGEQTKTEKELQKLVLQLDNLASAFTNLTQQLQLLN